VEKTDSFFTCEISRRQSVMEGSEVTL